MPNHAAALRTLAEKYLRMARTSDDRDERSKFLGYAALYAQLSDESVRKEVLSKCIVFTETTGDSLKPTGT